MARYVVSRRFAARGMLRRRRAPVRPTSRPSGGSASQPGRTLATQEGAPNHQGRLSMSREGTSVTIRAATPDDAEMVVAMVRALSVHEGLGPPGFTPAQFRRRAFGLDAA